MKKFIYLFFILFCILVGYFLFINFSREEIIARQASNQVKIKREPIVIEEIVDLTKFNENKAINSDYLGDMKIENLIDEHFVQTIDNEYYLSHDFNKNEFSQGTVFLDYRNSLDDQNIILYGHYVYKDENAMFSPLHLLKEEENYEKYKNIKLDFGNEVKEYVVSKVYYYMMGSETLIYYNTNYSDEDLNKYLSYVDESKFYDTGVEIGKGDRFLTLQTCVRNRDDLRLIIVAKEINNERNN